MTDDMITRVFNKKGQILTKQKTFDKLVALYQNDKYKKNKAAGAMGGAAVHRYIKKNEDGDFVCERDPL